MRIAFWNVRNGIANNKDKIEKLLAYAEEPQILIFAECEDYHIPSKYKYKSLLDVGYEPVAWTGDYIHKGLGVFAKPGLVEACSIRTSDDTKDAGYFIAFSLIGSKQDVIAVWSKTETPHSEKHYCHYVKAILEQNYDAQRYPLFIGDFNMSLQYSKQLPYAPQVFEAFTKVGLESNYHASRNIALGEETGYTFFMYGKDPCKIHGKYGEYEIPPLMLDYAFSKPGNIGSMNIPCEPNERKEWLQRSDHLPLVVDLIDSLEKES